ncbi:hypothetical protein FQN60_002151 [Etheostoma spectabile]|uniref:Uncharacterized protein n=1 Tax=Etheostoma spectabile TaxID=54343 RepID=A0A5J5D924_9PERO|nr:hypothetical protein FQN60_002151 [Etheostoma spectabile]
MTPYTEASLRVSGGMGRCGCTVGCTEPWIASASLKSSKQPKLVGKGLSSPPPTRKRGENPGKTPKETLFRVFHILAPGDLSRVFGFTKNTALGGNSVEQDLRGKGDSFGPGRPPRGSPGESFPPTAPFP